MKGCGGSIDARPARPARAAAPNRPNPATPPPLLEIDVRAIVFDGERLRLETARPEPTPGPGEAIVRPIRVGVCSTDLEIVKGYMNFRGVLGHEFVGVVEAINGPDTRGMVGRRAVGGINAVCMKCDLCRAGLSTHCRQQIGRAHVLTPVT